MNVNEAKQIWADLSEKSDMTDEQATQIVEAIKVLNSSASSGRDEHTRTK
jgi:hypothetical protein